MDEVAYLVERARTGDEHALQLLETAAFGGSDVAQAALGRTPASAPGFDPRADAAVNDAMRETAAKGGARFDVHLLVGVLGGADSFAVPLLAEFGLRASSVRRDARYALTTDVDWRAPSIKPFELLVLAHDERTSQSPDRLTGPEHVLLAMLLLGRGEASEVLTMSGLVYWDTREALRDLRARE